MPILSAFTPIGQLRFTSKDSRSRAVFDAMKTSQGPNFGTGGFVESRLYAQAMALGRVGYAQIGAVNQARPSKVGPFLTLREYEFNVSPVPGQTDDSRRAVLADRYKILAVPTLISLSAGLASILGSDFKSIATQFSVTDYLSQPNQATAPGNYSTGIMRIYVSGVDLTAGTSVIIAPAQLFPTGSYYPFSDQERFVLNPANPDLTEVLTGTLVGSALLFTPTKNHAAGTLIQFGNFPSQTYSIYRKFILILSATAALDASKRALVDRYLSERLKATATWQISSGAVSGFTLDTSLLDVTRL